MLGKEARGRSGPPPPGPPERTLRVGPPCTASRTSPALNRLARNEARPHMRPLQMPRARASISALSVPGLGRLRASALPRTAAPSHPHPAQPPPQHSWKAPQAPVASPGAPDSPATLRAVLCDSLQSPGVRLRASHWPVAFGEPVRPPLTRRVDRAGVPQREAPERPEPPPRLFPSCGL